MPSFLVPDREAVSSLAAARDRAASARRAQAFLAEAATAHARDDGRSVAVTVGRGLADTSVFIARESGSALDTAALPDEIGVSVVTIGELRAGVLAAADVETRARRLGTLAEALALEPAVVDERVAEAWAKLRLLLRDSDQRMPVNDSWIAATAMALSIPVVTQDDDYVDVVGLSVLRV